MCVCVCGAWVSVCVCVCVCAFLWIFVTPECVIIICTGNNIRYNLIMSTNII